MSKKRILDLDPYLGGLLFVFVASVRRRWPLLVGSTVVTMVLTFVVASLRPPIYEAQATVRVGRVDGAEPMNLQVAVSRINSLPFKQRVSKSMGLFDDNTRGAVSTFASLTAKPDAADTMLVSVQAASARDVQQTLTVIVRLLNDDRDEIRAPLRAGIDEQLAAIDANVSALREARERLETLVKMNTSDLSEDGASAFRSIWLLDLIQRNNERLAALRAERYALVSRLGSWRTYPTALLDGAYVTPRQVAPRPVRAMIAVGGLTLLVGVLYSLAWQPRRGSTGIGSSQGGSVAGPDSPLDPAGKAPC